MATMVDPTATATGRQAAATLGINTLGSGGDSEYQDYLAFLERFQQTQYYKDLTEAQRQQVQTASDQWAQSFGLSQRGVANQEQQTANTAAYQGRSLDLQGRSLDNQFTLGQGQLALGNRQLDTNISQFEKTFGLDQGKLGLSYLQTAATLASTPKNYFELADFAAGASERQDVPVFLQKLQAGVTAPSGLSAYGGTPQTLGVGGASAMLTGGGTSNSTGNATTDPNLKDALAVAKAMPPSQMSGLNAHDSAALNAIAAIYHRGPQALASGSLESLSPVELSLFESGGKRLGFDPASWQQGYQRTRQPMSLASAAAA